MIGIFMDTERLLSKPLMYEPLREWYRRPLGQLLGEAEQASLNEYLTNVFGYHLLLVAPPWQNATLDSSRMQKFCDPRKIRFAAFQQGLHGPGFIRIVF